MLQENGGDKILTFLGAHPGVSPNPAGTERGGSNPTAIKEPIPKKSAEVLLNRLTEPKNTILPHFNTPPPRAQNPSEMGKKKHYPDKSGYRNDENADFIPD